MTIDKGIAAWQTTNADDVGNARAEAVADALGELVGRRLERPTAHSIGKLFQKRLVGRPAWIGEGQIVATLQKFEGHNQNTYRVRVSASERSSSPVDGVVPADPS